MNHNETVEDFGIRLDKERAEFLQTNGTDVLEVFVCAALMNNLMARPNIRLALLKKLGSRPEMTYLEQLREAVQQESILMHGARHNKDIGLLAKQIVVGHKSETSLGEVYGTDE